MSMSSRDRLRERLAEREAECTRAEEEAHFWRGQAKAHARAARRARAACQDLAVDAPREADPDVPPPQILVASDRDRLRPTGAARRPGVHVLGAAP